MSWLTKVVSTTLVVVTGCTLAIGLTLFYMVATTLGKELDPITFGSMLTFAAAFAGVGYKQFKSKRETAWAEDDEGNAYRPPTRTPERRSRYDTGVHFDRSPARDEIPGRGSYTPPPALPPESVDERENAGAAVAPRPAEEEEYGD